MIVNERVVAYINSLDCGNSDICNTIEKEAIADEVPIIRKEMGNLLKVLLQLVQPERILEVGTAVGYSSILMSENMPEKCTITTIENYDKRIPVARNNFKRAGKENVITLIEGDALEVLKTLEGPYDFIFMDAAKGQYINYLPDIKRVLRKGGLLISDNILQEGEIVESPTISVKFPYEDVHMNYLPHKISMHFQALHNLKILLNSPPYFHDVRLSIY